MISDSLVSFVVVSIKSINNALDNFRQRRDLDQFLELQQSQQSEYLLQDQEETRSLTSSNENPENSTYDGRELKRIANIQWKYQKDI